jgi:chromosome segregation ATPase
LIIDQCPLRKNAEDFALESNMSKTSLEKNDRLPNDEENDRDTLIRENAFLKEYVIRLSKELQRTQNNKSRPKAADSITLPSNVLDAGMCVPLFSEYDARIEELCTFLDQQGSTLDKLTMLVKSLSDENLQLRKSCSDSSKLFEKQPLTSDMKCQDTEILEQQTELLVVELEQANKTISARDKSISDLSNDISSKLECIQKLTKRNKDLSNQKTVTERKVMEVLDSLESSKRQVCELEKKLKDVTERQEKMKSEAFINSDAKVDIEKQNLDLNDKLVGFSLTIQNLQNQLSGANSSFDKLNSEYIIQSKSLAVAKKNLQTVEESANQSEQKLRFMEEDSKRAKHLISEKTKIVESLSLAKDVLHTKVEALEKELSEIRNSEKLSGDRVHDALQIIKNQHQKSVESQDTLITSLKMQISQLQFELDRREKNLKDEVMKNHELEQVLSSERKARSDMNMVSRTLSASNELLESERTKLKMALAEIGSLKSTAASLQYVIDTTKSDYDRLKQETDASSKRYENEFSKLKLSYEELQTKSQTDRIVYQEEIDSEKEMNRRQRLTHQAELSAVNEKLKHHEQTLKDNKRIIEKYQNEIKSLSSKYKVDYDTIVEKSTSSITEMTLVHKKDTECISSLQEINTLLKEETCELQKLLQDVLVSNKTLENDKRDLEMKLSLLGNQLSASIGQHKIRLEKERNLKLELQSLKQEHCH